MHIKPPLAANIHLHYSTSRDILSPYQQLNKTGLLHYIYSSDICNTYYIFKCKSTLFTNIFSHVVEYEKSLRPFKVATLH